jgi:hypothetical protein
LSVKCFSKTRAPSDAQVHVLGLGGITRSALADAQLLVDRHDRVVGPLYVLHVGSARADDHGLARARDALQQRRVLEVTRRDLVQRNVQLFEKIHAPEIEWCGEHGDFEFDRALLQFLVFLPPEFERVAVGAVGRAVGVLVFVRGFVHLAREQRPVVALLQLHRIGAALLGLSEHRLGNFQIALMIGSNLCDDESVAFVVDLKAVEL